MKPVIGRIHSLESCGMVDGPGLRFVAFLQGCPLRCLYCHNPDSWKPQEGTQMSSLELVEEAWQYRTWMNSSGGGITLSGGEPLHQPEFVLDIIRRAHKKGMTVALDTSGFGSLEKTKDCLDETDLILLDIKSPLTEAHKNLTGIRADQPRKTLEYLKSINKPLWIRHVVVPGLTDGEESLAALKKMLMEIPSLRKFEFLPFHKMGEEKWAQEGLSYTLTSTLSPEKAFMERIQKDFSNAGIPFEEREGITAQEDKTA